MSSQRTYGLQSRNLARSVERLVLAIAAVAVIGCGGSPDVAKRSTVPNARTESQEPVESQDPVASSTRVDSRELSDTQTNGSHHTDVASMTKMTAPDSPEESTEEASESGAESVMERPDNSKSVSVATEGSETKVSPSQDQSPGNQDLDTESIGSPEIPESSDRRAESLEPAFRIFLPTTSGPLVVDVELRVGDQPLQAAFDKRIQAVIEKATDTDSKLTWNRLLKHVASDPAQFGRSPINSQQYRNVIQRYDRNRNKRPDQDEVARFLFRDSSYVGPFRLTGSDYFREVNRSQSAVFTAIDHNGNRVLEQEEIIDAGKSILGLDQNADRRIDFDEVVSFSADDNPAWKKRRSSRWGEVATDLSGYIDWSMLSYTISDIDRLGPFGQTRNVVAKLDQDQNNSVDDDEARGLLSVDADVRLLIQYPRIAAGAAKIEISSVTAELDPLIRRVESSDSIAIVGDDLRLAARVLDARTGRNSIPLEAFTMLDANNDGGLDESEIPSQPCEYSFEDLDEDQDGKLTLREINEGMNPKSPIWNVQVRARGAESPDAVFAWLDQNQDQFLSSREMIEAKDRLNAIASPEGTVRPADIPDSFLVLFGRGDPNQDNQLFGFTPPTNPVHEGRPRWAQSMDTNLDGDISRQEFPGTTAQFARLDRNRDGFIGPDEIPGS